MNEALVRHAMELLKGDIAWLLDARQGAPVGNSIVGSVLSIERHVPRQFTEMAVREALRRLSTEQA